MHNIAKINGQDAVAYQGATPWHRLGTPMMGYPDVTAALAAATLNWDVELVPTYARIKGKLKVVPGKRAVVRDVDSKIIATVENNYAPIQNRDAFGVLDAACREYGVTIETAGALGRGDRVWMLAKMPNSVEPVKGDRVDGYALLINGFNGWTTYSARLTTVRVVCQNTLTAALGQSSAIVKLRHVTSEVDQLEQVGVMLTTLVGTLKLMGESFAQLAAKKLSAETIDAYLDAVLGVPVTPVATTRWTEVRSLVTDGVGASYAPMSAWSAYNAVTQYVDHTRTATSPMRLRQQDQSALFGPAAKLKARALTLALSA